MARGHQKIQSQQKAQEKAAKIKKQEGHSAADQKKAAAAALKASCAVCKVNESDVCAPPPLVPESWRQSHSCVVKWAL